MEAELKQVNDIYQQISGYLVTYSFQIIGALFILAIGIYAAKKVSTLVENLMIKKGIDVTLSGFVAAGIKVLFIGMIAIMALGKIGISVTPFVAAIGALSLGAGLALQGLLSNYGAGVSIIVARPFVVGDTIIVQGVSGVVKEVRLAYTILTNEDEIQITIPNKHIVGEIIHNSSENSLIEGVVGISYDTDPEQAIAVIKKAIMTTSGISDHKEPQVGIENFGDSSINIGMRFWANTGVLFQTRYLANLAIFRALTDNNIEIPFPQRDVHLFDKTPK
ncbi:MAG: mechanosensitive ion channel [Pseudohongiella sp.]|nr:mechanosensitive ion channel [Pseudohongiella sp.]